MRVMEYHRPILAVLIVIVAAVALYSTFSPAKCADLACFEAHMAKCRSAIFVNDAEKEATWQYQIIGTSAKRCDVEVTLLMAKETSLDLREYEGQSMTCSHPMGAVGYPEKNLAACTGQLKEGMQAIVIEKLYKYIVANLGEIKEEIST